MNLLQKVWNNMRTKRTEFSDATKRNEHVAAITNKTRNSSKLKNKTKREVR